MTTRPLITVPEPPTGWVNPWPDAFEVADALAPSSWTLVGGLMVQLHAVIARVAVPRATSDVDAALHLETGVHTYGDAAAALRSIGYELETEQSYAYRFRRDASIVDLMVADHLAPSSRPRISARPVLLLPAGTQALRRTVDVDVVSRGSTHRLSLPNLHGALVLKAEAHRQDSRDPLRHLQDGIVLLACVDDVVPILDDLRGSDRRRLTHLITQLRQNRRPWLSVDRDVADLAEATLVALESGLADPATRAAADTTDEVAIDAMDAEAADAELAAIADGAETRSLSDVADSLGIELDRPSSTPEIR